jgi:glutamine amidotransferase
VKPRVVVLDYGSGNLRSAERALARVGAEVQVTSDAAAARDADALVVPGVGAFGACMDGIRTIGGDAVVRERIAANRPVLGICVGMQVLYARGVEHGVAAEGIGVLDGVVTPLVSDIVPHMGWNSVDAPAESVLFRGVGGQRFYFVHSYAATDADGAVATWAEHGNRFVAALERGPLAATQFHPEKSGDAGAELLANWLATVGR